MYACLYLKAADRMECTIELSPHVVPRSKRRFLRLVWQRYKPSQKETLQQKCFPKCNNTCLYTYVSPPPSRPHLTPVSPHVRSSSPFHSLSFCSPDEFPVLATFPAVFPSFSRPHTRQLRLELVESSSGSTEESKAGEGQFYRARGGG